MAFRLRDVRWRSKLLAGFLLIILTALIPVALALLSMQGMKVTLDVTHAENLEMERYNEIAHSVVRQEVIRRDYLLTGKGSLLAEEAELGRELAKLIRSTEGAVQDEEEAEELRRFLPLVSAGSERFASLVAAKKTGAGAEGHAGYLDESEKNLKIVRDLIEDSNAEIREADEKIREAAQRGTLISMVLAGISVLVGVGLSIMLASSITKPIAHLREVADRVSMSDLGATIDIDRKDEIGELAAAFSRMVVAVRFFAAEAEAGASADEPSQKRSSA